MLSGTNTTLNLLVLELVLHAALLAALLLGLLGLRLPVDAGTEDKVLADGGGVERGTDGVALLEAKFGPGSPLGHLRVDMFTDNGGLDPAGDLHFLVIIVEPVGDDGLGAVFVRDHLLRGERGGVVEFLVVCPIGTAVDVEKHGQSQDSRDFRSVNTYFPSRDMVCGVVLRQQLNFWDFFKRRIRCGFHSRRFSCGAVGGW